MGLIRLEFSDRDNTIGFVAAIVPVASAGDKPKLLDQVRDVIRRKHYNIRTEQAYVDWIKRFIIYHNKRHPAGMAEDDIAQFLTHLARDLNVAASTQNQALSALLFLYKEVLKQEIGWLEKVERARKPAKLPYCSHPSRGETNFCSPAGHTQADGRLALRKGLRLMECVRLRVKDIDFALAHKSRCVTRRAAKIALRCYRSIYLTCCDPTWCA